MWQVENSSRSSYLGRWWENYTVSHGIYLADQGKIMKKRLCFEVMSPLQALYWQLSPLVWNVKELCSKRESFKFVTIFGKDISRVCSGDSDRDHTLCMSLIHMYMHRQQPVYLTFAGALATRPFKWIFYSVVYHRKQQSVDLELAFFSVDDLISTLDVDDLIWSLIPGAFFFQHVNCHLSEVRIWKDILWKAW